MPKLVVVDRAGEEQTLEVQGGRSLMESLRDAGFSELVAMCGGCCSCATCHVHIDPDWLEAVGSPGADENDLLDGSNHRQLNSRLSCQIRFNTSLDGLRLTIAPEE